MNIKISFLGAARNVTGSKYLVEARGKRLLVDCGMYQEREFKSRNWDQFQVPPESVDAILLTHAHLDHCGFIPKFAVDGFGGRVHCTGATAEIAKIIHLDSGRIQEEDAARKARRHRKERRKVRYPERPLYTEKDARAAAALFSPVEYGRTLSLGDGLECTWHDAGHIFGSAMLELVITEGDASRKILFSGDIGRWGKPILRDPTVFSEADYVLCESTYGDRTHSPENTIADDLAGAVNATREAGGNLVIPSFAVERAHELMYHLNALLREDRVPHLRVFLDSPMAVRVTDVFKHHPEIYDREMKEYVTNGESPFDFPGLTLVRTVDESKSINNISGTAIIIAGSGMCTGGRIKHHLVRNLGRRESTILFVGYQARGTLGRHIVSGDKKVRIFGKPFRVRARVEEIHGFSGHADRNELMRWLSGLSKPPRRLFVTHGEEEASESFAKLVREEKGWEVSVPEYNESVELD